MKMKFYLLTAVILFHSVYSQASSTLPLAHFDRIDSIGNSISCDIFKDMALFTFTSNGVTLEKFYPIQISSNFDQAVKLAEAGPYESTLDDNVTNVFNSYAYYTRDNKSIKVDLGSKNQDGVFTTNKNPLVSKLFMNLFRNSCNF